MSNLINKSNIDKESHAGQFAGGWGEYSCNISEEDQQVFDRALEDLLGVSYTAVAVATQIVAGTNYSFFCNAKVVTPQPVPNEVFTILIYVNLQGEISLQNITPVKR